MREWWTCDLESGEDMAKKNINEMIELLDKHYTTEYKCYLDFKNAFELLIATILSAQCTDARVNIVTKELFQQFPNAKMLGTAPVKEIEKIIHSTGFYHNKAKNIIACAKVLEEQYQGDVPNDLELLTNLPGVGRKTANVVRGNIYKEPSIVVDTHVSRVSRRLGLTKEVDPVKIEFDLMKVVPKDHWILYNIQVIAFGREICNARSPKCEVCFMNHLCKEYRKKGK